MSDTFKTIFVLLSHFRVFRTVQSGSSSVTHPIYLDFITMKKILGQMIKVEMFQHFPDFVLSNNKRF